MRIRRDFSIIHVAYSSDWDLDRPLWRLWFGDYLKMSWWPHEPKRFMFATPKLTRFIRGRSYVDHKSDQSYMVIPGPWSLRVWRRRYSERWYGIPQIVFRVNRPGPVKPHRAAIGPFRLVIAPAVGTLRPRGKATG